MDNYTDFFVFGLGLALILLWEWQRRKRDRRQRLLRNLREVLGPELD